MATRGWLFCAGFSFALGCASDTSKEDGTASATGVGSASDSGSEDPVAEAHGVRVTVRSAREVGRVADLYAGPKDRYVVVDLTVDNVSRSTPIPVVFAAYTVRTATAVEFLAADATAFLSEPCDAEVLVSEGGTYDCSVAFSVPHEQDPVAVVYRPEVDLEVVVEFDSEPCDPCGDDCVDLTSDPAHCGACSNAVTEKQTCIDGQATCNDGLTLCADGCVDLLSDSKNCGSCGTVVPACVDGMPGCPPGYDSCPTGCRDLQIDHANCGYCDKLCGIEFDCEAGQCTIAMDTMDTTLTCDAFCGQQGLACGSADMEYRGNELCQFGGGGTGISYTFPAECSVVAPQTKTAEIGACTFNGDAYRLRCTCVDP